MILRRALRPQAITRTFEQIPNRALLQPNQQHTRRLHNLPYLGHENIIGNKFSREGVPGFLTAKAFQQIWTVYTQSLVDKINQNTAGTDWQNKSVKEIHNAFSRQPNNAALYNAAAMAHFNHLFFESLRSEPVDTELNGAEFTTEAQINKVNTKFREEIEASFDGSIDNLRDAMLDHANAIFGNGFVWLVRYKEPNSFNSHLKVLCTYNAGSPYSEAYKMRQDVDRTVGSEPPRYGLQNPNTAFSRTGAGVGADGHAPPNALKAQPLLCINVWQLAYVIDYGMSPVGKETYTKAWWQTIDWQVVANRATNSDRESPARAGYMRQ